jgi:tetratricopeptide (TPR) repeat protein
MRGTHGALALIVLIAAGSAARAQEYPSAAPVPRTTSIPALHAIARTREVRERFVRGINDEQRGQWSAAASEFERIIVLHPNEPQYSTAHYDLGIAYANMKRFDDSAHQFEEALTGDPGFLAAMANLIAVDLARGNLTQARAIADRFVRAAPDSARALYSRGIIGLRTGDFLAARNDFSQLLHNDPQYAVAHYNLGIAQTRLHDYSSAEREFGVALDLAPAYARARFALGTVLLREGKRTQARDAFERVVRDANGDPALQNLALAMRDAIHAP